MSYSSFTKERQFAPAQAKSRADNILADSQRLVDQMRAVNEFELKAQANLVTNLRQHRQDESRRDTQNHQLIIQGLKQRAALEQRQASVNAKDKAQRIRDNEAKLDAQIKAFSDISMLAGKAVAGEIERAKAEVDEAIAEQEFFGGVLDPQSNEGDALGVQAKLVDQENHMLLDTVLESTRGKGKLFGIFPVVSEGYVKAQTARQFALREANTLASGGIEGYIRANPDVTIPLTDPATNEEIQFRIGDIFEGNPDERLFNEFYKILPATILKEKLQSQGLYNGVDPSLFAPALKKLNEYASSRTLDYSRHKIRALRTQKREVFKDRILTATTPDSTAVEMKKFVDYAIADPTYSITQAYTDIITLLPQIGNPEQVVDLLVDKIQAVVPNFSEQNQARALRVAALEAQRGNIKKANDADTTFANNYVDNTLLPEILRDEKFSPGEMQLVRNSIDQKVANNFMSRAQGVKVKERALYYYKKYNIDPVNIALFKRQLASGEVSIDDLNEGAFDDILSFEELQKLKSDFTQLTEATQSGEIFGFSDSQVVRNFKNLLMQRAKGADPVTGDARHYSVQIAADAATRRYQQLRAQYAKEGMTAVEAAKKAQAQVIVDIRSAKPDSDSLFAIGIDPEVSLKDKIAYPNVIPGSSDNALRVASSPRFSPNTAGAVLRSDPSYLLSKGYNPEFDNFLTQYRNQIRDGIPITLSDRDKEIIEASGLTAREYLDARFKANHRDVLGPEGFPDIVIPENAFDNLMNQVEDNTRLKELLNKDFNFGVDQFNNVTPAYFGVGKSAFNNAVSVSTKLGSPMAEIVAARFMVNTDNGRDVKVYKGKTPTQYLSQLNQELKTELGDNYSSFTVQTPLNALLAALPDGDSLRGLLNQELGVYNRLPRAGMTTTIARMGNTGRINSTNLSADIAKGTSRTNLIPMIQKAAMRHNIPAPILAGLLMKETSFIEIYLTGKEKSDAGAIGAGQFLPATAEEHGVNPYDIPSSINGAAKYLRYLVNYFGGDMRLALYAYNGGMGNIKEFNGPIPGDKENNEYVPLIMNFARRYGYGQ